MTPQEPHAGPTPISKFHPLHPFDGCHVAELDNPYVKIQLHIYWNWEDLSEGDNDSFQPVAHTVSLCLPDGQVGMEIELPDLADEGTIQDLLDDALQDETYDPEELAFNG